MDRQMKDNMGYKKSKPLSTHQGGLKNRQSKSDLKQDNVEALYGKPQKVPERPDSQMSFKGKKDKS